MDSVTSNLNLKVCFETYGCKVNTYDTGLLQKKFKQNGFDVTSDSKSNVDVVVLNTCAVTAEATKEALRKVRKIKRQRPDCKVVVTGCSAQVDSEKFEEADGVDLIVGNSHKSELSVLIKEHLLGQSSQKLFKSDIFKKEDLGAGGGEELNHTRSFLKIQDGCNSFCTFCVIPFARGKSQSLSIKELVAQVNKFTNLGVKEVVLTGVHIGDYRDLSKDSNNSLEDLCEQILSQTSISRLRLSSLEPVELTPRLLDLYSDKRLCPHFHMSIQSAEDSTLASMKRQYGALEVERALNKINKKIPNAFVGMDVIAGFPSETKTQFLETRDRLKNLPWTKIHVFPYSPRPKTYANRIEALTNRTEILERAFELRSLSHERFSQKAIEQMGRVKEGLVLQSQTKALSRDYWPIKFLKALEVGTEVNFKITGYERDISKKTISCLVGEPV